MPARRTLEPLPVGTSVAALLVVGFEMPRRVGEDGTVAVLTQPAKLVPGRQDVILRKRCVHNSPTGDGSPVDVSVAALPAARGCVRPALCWAALPSLPL